MKNILDYVNNGRPKRPVSMAAENLLRAGLDAGDLPDGDFVEFETTKKDEIVEKIHRTINHLGRNLGPAQNARAELDTYYRYALDARYNFNDDEVCSRFGYFLLAVVTEGFEGLDNTGTQMGGFQGSWRGGGFE